uniref:Uncharacterized protein n=1 Tax=Rhizobium rhizogenes TaxID=359 RepID=A0A7S5DR42_RHIRH|nr:hypothetical protein pC6.5c_509 [Rhizobium rhizogenes]
MESLGRRSDFIEKRSRCPSDLAKSDGHVQFIFTQSDFS